MSGGEAFFLAAEAELTAHLGPDRVAARGRSTPRRRPVSTRLLEEHLAATGSPRVEALLDRLAAAAAARFVHLAPGLPPVTA